MSNSIFEVVVIGAGHAGLATSYLLNQNGIDHVVLEKGRIGETWRSQRWDSFALNTNNETNLLPGDTYEGPYADGFDSANDLADAFARYAKKFKLPVHELHQVISVQKNADENIFTITTLHNNQKREWKSRQVVIASGRQNVPRIPEVSDAISPAIFQVHSGLYKNENQLPPGNVLVVGSAQTGCQITEDLLEAGRKVFLSTSAVGRTPRRYRGRDIMHWLSDIGMLDRKKADVTNPADLEMRSPQVSGVGRYGHTISLQSLAKKGAVLLGRFENTEGDTINFKNNASDNVRFGDTFSGNVKGRIDQFILHGNLAAPAPEHDENDIPDPECTCLPGISSLNLHHDNISAIVWASGFRGDFSYIKHSVCDEKGVPIHHEGISDLAGLYYIGFPWLRKLKSALIRGIEEDARFITDAIASSAKTEIPFA